LDKKFNLSGGTLASREIHTGSPPSDTG